MAMMNKETLGRIVAGLGVVGALALMAGVLAPIEAKLPTDLDIPAVPERKLVPTPRSELDRQTVSALMVSGPDTRRATAAAAVTAPGAAQRFEIASAERLTIKFQGYAELTGEYRVNPDQTISIPVLGRISVGKMTPADLELALAERASRVTGRETYITVEISEYRPVFVTGYVNRPGASPWKPGMTVLHAVTLLGGVYRATADNVGGGMVIGADNEIVRLRRATTDLRRVIAGIARLQAEREDKGTILVPDKLIALVGKVEAERLIGEQTTALTSRRTGRAAQLASLERARKISEQELVGLQEQSVRLKAMLATRRDYKQKIDGLQAKGIVRADRSMEETSRVSELEDRATTVSVGIARVQGALAGLERETIYLNQDRLATIDTELLKQDREVAQLELEIESARNAYRKMTGAPAPVTFSEGETAKTSLVEYEIVRDGAGQTSVKVDQFTLLLPGDILVVSTRQE